MSKEMPWLDIAPTSYWDQYIVQFKVGDAKFNGGGIKSLLDSIKLGRRVGHNEFLTDLRNLVNNYHNVPKACVESLNMRAALLEQIAQKAEKHLREYNVDAEKNRQGWHREKEKGAFTKEKQTKVFNKALNQNVTKRESVDVTPLACVLAKLIRRARRKAEYIRELKRHLDNKSKGFGTAPEFLEYLFRNRQRTDGLLALTPDVLIERMDPWHRAVEVSIQQKKGGKPEVHVGNSLMGRAFGRWFSRAEANSLIPFFVWLEGNFICTGVQGADSEDASVKEVTRVTYQGQAPLPQIVLLTGGLAYTSADDFQAPLDSHYVKISKRPGAFAFVWTKCDQLICAPHVSGSFHHSSFTGGAKVKCAGMIEFTNGKVTYVSNDSGHYKPGTNHLRAFIQFLQSNQVVAQDASVEDKVTKKRQALSEFL